MQSNGVESHRLAKEWLSSDWYSNGTGWQCYAKEWQGTDGTEMIWNSTERLGRSLVQA
jgi:hypothetical protein